MKNKRTFIIATIIVAVILVGIGYAAMSNVTLKINGSATATTNDANFDVKFTGTPTTGGQGTTNAEIDSSDSTGRTATINVSGLTTKGDKATATYTITNASADLNANLSAAVTTNSEDTYFKVTPTLAKTSITAGANTTVTVEVELLKTPVNDVSSNITVTLTATPVQQ